MSRPLRLHAPGLLHHIVSRGDNRACIFDDDEDYRAFLDDLRRTLARFEVRCAAYCLLWNHYHLLLVPTEHTVSRLMQQLNSAYCQRFNRRHGRVGHVLQGRFGCKIVEDGAYARAVLRYVALNPVAAGRAPAPDAWQWSSYRAVIGMDNMPDFLSCEDVWAAFGTSDAAVGRSRFTEFVRAGLQERFNGELLLGSDRLASAMAPLLEPYQPNRDFVYGHRFAARVSLGVLMEGCIDRVSIEDASHAAFFRHGYTLAEIARCVDRDPSTISRWIQRAHVRRLGSAPS